MAFLTEEQKYRLAMMRGTMSPDYAQMSPHALQNTDDKFAVQMAAGERMSPNPAMASGMAKSGFAPASKDAPPPKGKGTVEGRQAAVDAQRKYANQLRGRKPPKGMTAGPYNVYYGPNVGESIAHATNEVMGGYMAGQAKDEAAEIDIQRGLEKAAAAELEQARHDETRGDVGITQGQAQARIDAAAGKEDTRKDELKAELALNKAHRIADLEAEKDAGKLDHDRAMELERLKAELKGRTKSKAEIKLEEGRSTRLSTINKGAKFLTAFNSGAESGATRAGLDWIPGQFTDQAAFDEELDAFAEKAARAELKAVGEIRPTDADVDGMKAALFGVGKGEQVNINLLNEYVNLQVKEENKLLALEGEDPYEMPNTDALEGDWYGQLFEGKTAASKETAKALSEEDFLALSPEKRDAYLKANQ